MRAKIMYFSVAVSTIYAQLVLTGMDNSFDKLVSGFEVRDERFEDMIASVPKTIGPVQHGNTGELRRKVELWQGRVTH